MIGLYAGLLTWLISGGWQLTYYGLVMFNLVSAVACSAAYLTIIVWQWSERWIERGE